MVSVLLREADHASFDCPGPGVFVRGDRHAVGLRRRATSHTNCTIRHRRRNRDTRTTSACYARTGTAAATIACPAIGQPGTALATGTAKAFTAVARAAEEHGQAVG